MIETRVEVCIPQALLETIISGATQNAVLVGGQALAFWVSRYNIEIPPLFAVGAISDDADFLGSREDIQGIAKQTRGTPTYASKHTITALVGQVTIPISNTEFANVDVLHKLVGMDVAAVRERASIGWIGQVKIMIMHPMDVFMSRVENLSKLKDKQNPQGIEQTKLGLLVARHFIEEVAAMPETGQRNALTLINYVAKIAKNGDGHRVTRDYGIDFRTAIPSYVIESEAFKTKRLPQLLLELQPPTAQ